MKILLDNGHGSDTKGKHSPDNPPSLREPTLGRKCPALLKGALEKEGFEVIMVTPEETDTSLTTRVKRINDYCSRYGTANRAVSALRAAYRSFNRQRPALLFFAALSTLTGIFSGAATLNHRRRLSPISLSTESPCRRNSSSS